MSISFILLAYFWLCSSRSKHYPNTFLLLFTTIITKTFIIFTLKPLPENYVKFHLVCTFQSINGSLKFILEMNIHSSIIYGCTKIQISLKIVNSMIQKIVTQFLSYSYTTIDGLHFIIQKCLTILRFVIEWRQGMKLHKTITLSDLCVYKIVKVVFNVSYKLLWSNFITVSGTILFIEFESLVVLNKDTGALRPS